MNLEKGSYVRLLFRDGRTAIGKVRSQREDGAWNIRYSYPSPDFGFWVVDIPVEEKHLRGCLREATEQEFFLYSLKNGVIKD
jgi:hypothetical protein